MDVSGNMKGKRYSDSENCELKRAAMNNYYLE
jgi:hypothetical protein